MTPVSSCPVSNPPPPPVSLISLCAVCDHSHLCFNREVIMKQYLCFEFVIEAKARFVYLSIISLFPHLYLQPHNVNITQYLPSKYQHIVHVLYFINYWMDIIFMFATHRLDFKKSPQFPTSSHGYPGYPPVDTQFCKVSIQHILLSGTTRYICRI